MGVEMGVGCGLIRSPSVRVSPRWSCLASLLPVFGRLLSVGTAASQKKGGSFLLLCSYAPLPALSGAV